MSREEKAESDLRRACYDWQAKKAIENIRSGMRSEQYVPAVEKYMTQDLWISQVWLKKHPDWKTLTAGAAPKDCPNP
jgi:hypothetical protein